MAPSESDLARLIGRIYETTEDAARWAEFLEDYAHTLGAEYTFFQLHHFAERRSSIVGAYGMASPLKAEYNAYYGRLNVWRNHGQHHYVEGQVMLDPEVFPREVLLKTEFYNDCLVRLDALHSAAGVIARRHDDAFVLTAMNDHRHGPWGPAQKRFIGLLLPHVRRAYALQEQLRLSQAERVVLSTLDVGIVFLTRRQQIVSCNQIAEDLLRRGTVFTTIGGTFRAVDREADVRLRHAASEAMSDDASQTCPPAVLVERPDGARPYQVLATPLRGSLPMLVGLRSPEAVLLIVDPEQRRRPPAQLLKRLYGLTAREAALAEALSCGHTVERAAADLGMTYQTARSHLRRVFDKTNTSRQSELVVLLSRLPTTAPDG